MQLSLRGRSAAEQAAAVMFKLVRQCEIRLRNMTGGWTRAWASSVHLSKRKGHGRPRWSTIMLLQSDISPTNSFFTYSFSTDCFPEQTIAHRQWLGNGTHWPTSANDGENSYSLLSATWRRASSFPGSLPRHHWIPGLLYLFPSGATRATSTCQKKRKPISSPHSSTLTAYAKFIS